MKKQKLIQIKTSKGLRLIGPDQPAFIVAEMSGNHNQSFFKAKEIINAAAEAGVDAIKLQTYTPDTITIDSDLEYFKIKGEGNWSGQTLYELYKKAYTPWEWHEDLKKHAEEKGLLFFSTPFDSTAVDFLEKMEVQLYKIASFEVVDVPLLKKVANTKKPVIISRGMASEEEIELAIKTLKENGTPQVAVLHCVSAYPAKPQNMNLKTIPDLAKKFGVIAGLSDHSLSGNIPVVAVALGANIIEKHITLDRNEEGVDSGFSLEPVEFKEMVKNVRKIEKALGRPSYGAGLSEESNLMFRKSIFAVEDIKAGEKINENNIKVIRPGHGLNPKYYEEIIGKRPTTDIKKNTPLTKENIDF